jgi:uncharacterized protein (DUF2384 family)
VRERLLDNLDGHVSMKKLYDQWAETFGQKEVFETWLHTPHFLMWWSTPYSMIQTPEGKQTIYEELIRIEHGICC